MRYQLEPDAIIQSLNIKSKGKLAIIVRSQELDTILQKAVEYCKWFVHIYLLQKQQEQSSSARLKELPQQLVNVFLPMEELSYSEEMLENLTIETATSLEQAKLKSKMVLKEFGRAYCNLLLFTAKFRVASSKERECFEKIYQVYIRLINLN